MECSLEPDYIEIIVLEGSELWVFFIQLIVRLRRLIIEVIISILL